MIVHSFLLGIVNRLYFPAGRLLPSTNTGLLNSIVVAAFAPVRQTSPNGSFPPTIVLPREEGRQYTMFVSTPSILALSVSKGLKAFSCAYPIAAESERIEINKIFAVFILIEFR